MPVWGRVSVWLRKVSKNSVPQTRSSWRDRLTCEPLGKQWLAHLQFDIDRRNIPAELLESFFEAVEQATKKGIPELNEEAPAPVLKTICNILNRASHEFDLSGIRRPGDLEKCCRVMDLDSFGIYHARKFCFEYLGAEVTETQLGSILWEHFDELTPEWYEGELRTERPFFWAALKRRVDEIEGSSSDKATMVRNCLGLDMGQNKRLVRIEIPEALLTEKKVCAPTMLDAGASRFFKPADDPQGFGWTLHLETLEPGAEELVIEKINLTGECELRILGAISTTVPELDWDDSLNSFKKR